uniref:Uncharacterized protein n=1 Tax=Phenylobacterium glaciei TaxID=2803784 RepID=A0A974P4W1_9CAUL|nr:hypothetical protein JKL49_02040 [Phenylobacterium glaciei]
MDKAKGRILLSLPAPDADGVSGRFLYLTALRTGMGSAPVGLDRAAIRETQVLVFRRIGKKVIAEYENPASAPPARRPRADRRPRGLRHIHGVGGRGGGDGRRRPHPGGHRQFPDPRCHGAADALKGATRRATVWSPTSRWPTRPR